jgi:acetyl-CoA C-acetyltransferase
MQETPKEMAFEACKMALESCGLTWDKIEAVCFTTAPDTFDGLHMNGEYVIDGSGAYRKPFMRSYVGGGSGVFVGAHGFYTVASGMFDLVLVVAEEKMSNCMPHPQAAFLTIFDNILERPLGPNLLWIFALEMNRYMSTHKIRLEDIALVSVHNKRNALDHPAAMLGEELTVEDIMNSEVLAWPVHRLMVSPVTDGAVALIFAEEKLAQKLTDKPVWIRGVGWSLDTAYWTNRDLYYPEYVEKAAWMAYKMAGINNPRKQIDFAEPYDPFAYKMLHHMEGLQLCGKGEAIKLVLDGSTQRDGRIPCCPSGGLLGVGNPIAAAGLMKVAELYWQLSGQAGKRQIQKLLDSKEHFGVAQAWGDLMQVGTVVVMSNKKGKG